VRAVLQRADVMSIYSAVNAVLVVDIQASGGVCWLFITLAK